MGKLQSEFGQSANSMMDNAGSLKLIDAKVSSFTVPKDFEGNKAEFQRRSKEGLQRYMGDQYMLSIQNQTGFHLKEALAALPKTETPTTLNERAAIIENRVITAGEKIDPTKRLRNATMDQQKFLETAATALRDESIKTGSVSADGAIKDFAQVSYKRGLVPADVANYAALTEGVAISQDTLNKFAALSKPQEEPRMNSPSHAPAANVSP